MFKNIFLLISIPASIVLSGCGSSSIDNNQINTRMAKEFIIPTVPDKIDRANWDNVEQLTDGFSITDNDDTISFKITDDRIRDKSYKTEVIFINADLDPNTGYIHRDLKFKHIGAEYLISEGNLYKYKGNGWHWDFVSRLDRKIINDNEIEIEIKKELIQSTRYIMAISGMVDNDWSYINMSNVVTYKQDGDIPNKVILGNFKLSENKDNLIFTFKSPKIANGEIISEDIFINADNNIHTGYTNSRVGFLGEEYLIEGNALYSFTGTQGWNWNLIGYVERDIHDDLMTITLSKDQVNLQQKILVTASLADKNWTVVEKYLVTKHNMTNYNENEIITATSDEDSITFTLTNYGRNLIEDLSPDYPIPYFCIDADNNELTGGNHGVEYCLEATKTPATKHFNGDSRGFSIFSDSIKVMKHTLNLNQVVKVYFADRIGIVNLSDIDFSNGSDHDTTLIGDYNPSWGGVLSYKFDSTLLKNGQATHQTLFLDTDNDKNTGYSSNRWGWGLMGADYLIQDDKLYRYADIDGWNWIDITDMAIQEHLGWTMSKKDNDDSSVTISIPLSGLKDEIEDWDKNIRYMPALSNNKWETLDTLNDFSAGYIGSISW